MFVVVVDVVGVVGVVAADAVGVVVAADVVVAAVVGLLNQVGLGLVAVVVEVEGGWIEVLASYQGLMKETPEMGLSSNWLRPSHRNRNHWH